MTAFFPPLYLALMCGGMALSLLFRKERTVRMGIGIGETSYRWLWWTGVIGGTAGFLLFGIDFVLRISGVV